MHRRYYSIRFIRGAKSAEKEEVVLKEWEKLEEESNAPIPLLRRLLRECSYLPDPVARAYLRPFIISRFREYHANPAKKQASPKRRKAALDNAKKQFRLLQRANQGELKPLEKVLSITYGRIGKRRHELLAPLLQPGTPVQHPQNVGTVMGKDNIKPGKPLVEALSSTTVEASRVIRRLKTNDHVSTVSRDEVDKPIDNDETVVTVAERIVPLPSKTYKTIPQITPQLEALARSQKLVSPSQKLVSPAEVTRSNPKDKDLTPHIPEKNAWAQPLAINRRVNIVKKWYAKLLEHILPPVSETEWNRLRDLASGKLKWEGLRKRRPAAKPLPFTEEERLIPYAHSARSALTTEIGISKAKPDKSERIRGHTITARFMRRLWGKIFAQCPMMTWDTANKQWQVVWGHTNWTSSGRVENVRSVDMAMFEGVNEEGERVEPTTKAERRALQQTFPPLFEGPLDYPEARPADNARG